MNVLLQNLSALGSHSAASLKRWPHNLCAIAELIEIIRPVLHHAHTLIPIFAARVDSPRRVCIQMRELPLDRIGMPHAHLVEKSRGCRTEAMRGHLLAAITETPKGRAHRILGHAPPGSSK